MAVTIPDRMEKCKGAMLATAIGDALGWPNERCAKKRKKEFPDSDSFVEWTRNVKRPRWHCEVIRAGEYSDDTQLTLSVARSMIAGEWKTFFTRKELPFWLEYERGGGRALRKAAEAYRKGVPFCGTKAFWDAGGNGAVMRILPHVISAVPGGSPDRLMEEVAEDAFTTHGHPRAVLGATCYAYALDYLLKKETVLEYGELIEAVRDGKNIWGRLPVQKELHFPHDYCENWEAARAHMVQKLEWISSALKKGLLFDDEKAMTELECFGEVRGAGDVTILTALYFASKYANNPVLGVQIPAFAVGSDTDTIASVTGGLLGMLNGTEWIPGQWKKVQDRDCLLRITEMLSEKEKAVRKMGEKTEGETVQWMSSPIGKMKPVGQTAAANGKNGEVLIEKWETLLGQTLYRKKYQPGASPQSALPGRETSDGAAQAVEPKVSLSGADLETLLSDPRFNKSITAGKMLKIMGALLAGGRSAEEIAQALKVRTSVVECIAQCLHLPEPQK